MEEGKKDREREGGESLREGRIGRGRGAKV